MELPRSLMASNEVDDWVDVPLTSVQSSEEIDDWVDVSDSISKTPSQLEALGRGTLQGASMGFSDEATGLGESAIQSLLESLGQRLDDKLSFGDQYTKSRDEARAANLAAQEANPWSYGTGNLAGAIGTGLIAGGAGVLGKGLGLLGKKGAQTALTTAASKGTLGGLTAIGATEGALSGLGTSEADLTKGEFGEAALDTAIGTGIGTLAPGALQLGGKVLKGTANLGKTGLKATPILGKITTHLADVTDEGTKNLGKSFDTAAIEATGELTDSVEDIAAKALAQKAKYASDLKAGSTAANRQTFKAAEEFKDEISRALNVEGKALESIDDEIAAYTESLPDTIGITPEGVKIGKFDFSGLDDSFNEAIKDYQGSPTGNILRNMQDKLQTSDYREVTKQLRKLNSMIGDAPRDLQPTLMNIKKSMEQTIDQHLNELPGDLGKQLYGDRMDKAKDYSLLASARDALKTGKDESTADLLRKASFIANPESPEGLELTKYLSKAYQSGDQEVTKAANNLTKAAENFNKFQVFNPEKGKMGLGKNEDLYQLYSEVFGEPTKYGLSSSMATNVEDLVKPSGGATSTNKQREFIKWVKETYGEKADDFIAELQARSKKFQTLKAGLDWDVEAGQDISSMIRGIKKAADPLAFMAGKSAQHTTNVAKTIGEKTGLNTLNRATTLRALTQPQNYKETVEKFKQSQQNNGVVPENE